MARNDPQVNIRLPADLKTRLEAAAAESQRSFKAEIVARLEDSFEDPEGYRGLAELAIASMQENVENRRLELEEYRETFGTIRVMRYMINMLVGQLGANISEDLHRIIGLLFPSLENEGDDLADLLTEVMESKERRNLIVAERASGSPVGPKQEERQRRLEKLVARLRAKKGGEANE